MLRTIHYSPTASSTDSSLRSELDQGEILSLLESPVGLLWVDIQNRSQENHSLLKNTFKLHQLVIDDILDEDHIPKVDDWGPYLYIVLSTISVENHRDFALNSSRLDVVMHAGSLLTIHDGPISPLESIWSAAQADQDGLTYGPVYLLYQIANTILNDYSVAIERIMERYEFLKAQVIHRPVKETLEAIIDLKESLLLFRRKLGGLQAVFNKLTQDDYRFIDQRSKVYLRDVHEHLNRILLSSETILELTNDLQTIYLSGLIDRSNSIIKPLVIVGMIVLPLMCIFGFFSMNFFISNQPITALVGRPVFVLLFIIMLAFPFLVFWFLRRQGWL